MFLLNCRAVFLKVKPTAKFDGSKFQLVRVHNILWFHLRKMGKIMHVQDCIGNISGLKFKNIYVENLILLGNYQEFVLVCVHPA